jgi:acid phosphatase type 7
MIFKIQNFLLLMGLIAFRGEINAQSEQVHLSWSGNNVKTYSTMTVSWISDDLQTPEFVAYGTTTSNLSTIKAQKTVAEGRAFHKVFLKNLQPSTTYIYRCGADATGWSDNYTFTTGPLPGERKTFKVGVLGDTQNNEYNEDFGKTAQILGQLLPFKPDFTLHMGDIVNNGSMTADWLNFMKVAQPLNAVAPMMPTLGNHDIENLQGENFQKPFSSFYELFSLPRNGLDYSFDYGNTHFVCIFSGFAMAASENGLLRYSPASKEYKWLEKDLSEARSNPRIDWIVAYTHYPLYSFGWSNVQQWKEALSPIFDKFHVDICLSGHRHVYERHHPLFSGMPAPDGKGTVYITNGTAGGSPQGLGGEAMPTMAFTSSEKMYNFATMTIDGKKLIYELFDQNSKKIDTLIIIK